MKKIVVIASCLAGMAFSPLHAQEKLSFGGAVLNHDIMTAGDFAALSQPHSFGTARVMGMGGAFVSLGADLSSMSLNPAGLGMYRRNEISLTPLLSLSHAETAGTNTWMNNNKSRFAFANVGVALNVLESSTNSLTSLTIGFGMNRIADFNTRYSYSEESVYDPRNGRVMPTIADLFSQQLGQAGIYPDKNGHLGYEAYNPYFWPAILGYNGFMMSPIDGVWIPDLIGHNASVLHSMDVVNSGSINEFTLSAGANFDNVVYIGASLGIQSVHKKTGVTYQEEYFYYDTKGIAVNGAGQSLAAQLAYANLYQQTVVDGTGVNFKVGVVVRPVAGLRVGVAFHTPTYYSLDRTYGGEIVSTMIDNQTLIPENTETNQDWTPVAGAEGSNSWDFVSPSRLMFGASYTFGNFAIVSLDYERDWYNGIRVKNVPAMHPNFAVYPEDYKWEFKHNFCATNSVRGGIEVKPLPMLALRVGGGYTSSMLKDPSIYINAPVATDSHYFTAGLGFTLSRSTVLDIAYQNATYNNSAYQLFFSLDENTGEFKTYSGLYDTKYTRHYISLTLGFRF